MKNEIVRMSKKNGDEIEEPPLLPTRENLIEYSIKKRNAHSKRPSITESPDKK